MALGTPNTLFASYDPRVQEKNKCVTQVIPFDKGTGFAILFRALIGEMIVRELTENSLFLNVHQMIEDIKQKVPEDLDGMKAWYLGKEAELMEDLPNIPFCKGRNQEFNEIKLITG